MHIRGHVDKCDGEIIAGWIFDLDSPTRRIGLEIFMGGSKVADVAADNFRADLLAAGLSDGKIAFSFMPPPHLPRAAAADIRLKVSGSDLFMDVPQAAVAQPTATTHSRFGGLWIDKADWLERLAFKHRRAEIDDDEAARLFRFVRDGYTVIEGAVSAEEVAEMNADIERVWQSPPPSLRIETFEPDGAMRIIPPDLEFREGRTKLLDLYTVSRVSQKVTANAPAMRFLSLIFEDKPKAFQQLTFWRGSQQAMHKDTAYVKIDTNPLALAATWLALEEVKPGTGELEYYVGSHRAPDFMFGGVSKWVQGYETEHDRFLASLHEDAARYGHRRSAFHGKPGDVLVWHADLAHGGTQITQPGVTRRSLVTHFTGARDIPFYRRTGNYPELETPSCVFTSEHAAPIGT